ncbi:MAG: hypothetical protein QOD42_2253 [Sphingomonadales bacterium]|jgi:hypothetical protein|nr:hypothetical protein [Sphingomonadales bacterium]
MKQGGFAAPILVGGAAAELYSGSAITTGDFDVVAGLQGRFEEVLRNQGFTRPAGPGHSPLGWIHADLRLGFEVVSDTLLDGLQTGSAFNWSSSIRTERSRLFPWKI